MGYTLYQDAIVVFLMEYICIFDLWMIQLNGPEEYMWSLLYESKPKYN